ncbi:type II toxin-antitoxin system Phd/YefM family antitoxin [Sphingomonas rubra]|uniref:Antitoxin component of toxin-antitoxin stability system, DNA-binding transcriptional repressor n=1 Tax=Sphingomonas rubra TaxID=634430 RepID=A0A1I5TU80_9SPHN|nr:type II toxin-antitoxin system Phd/YefM family antitoxin [Sphingomonas rubra]SFP86614.1 Antitoxin component of toxin-antitoxin stability system, DNA-binding transcriptional repressor [Sphingomonas rubra]
MATVNMHEAKTHLSRLVEALVSGAEQEVVIARNGTPAVKMTVVEPKREPRRFGFAKGRYELSDEFDKLDAEIADLFEESADPYGDKLDR